MDFPQGATFQETFGSIVEVELCVISILSSTEIHFVS